MPRVRTRHDRSAGSIVDVERVIAGGLGIDPEKPLGLVPVFLAIGVVAAAIRNLRAIEARGVAPRLAANSRPLRLKPFSGLTQKFEPASSSEPSQVVSPLST